MPQVTIETVAYPSWWANAPEVQIDLTSTAGGSYWTVPRENVELLPQGVAIDVASPSPVRVLVPWSSVARISRVG
jgi:hypothetical protein